MTTEVVNLFEDETTAPGGSDATPPIEGSQPDMLPPATNGKSRKPAGKGTGGVSAAKGSATVAAPDAAPSVPPADAGTPDNQITSQAQDELAKLAAKNEAKASGKKGKDAGAAPAAADAATPSTTDASSAPTSDAQAEAPVQAEGESLYDFRQREMAWAKERGKNQARSKGGKKLSKAELARREKAKAKEKADREKAKAKEKTQKQKDKETARAKAKKDAAEARKKAETERKAKLEKEKAERAEKRALAAVPSVIRRDTKDVQQAFAEDFRAAAFMDVAGKPLKMIAGKTGKQIVAPGQNAMRRQKCDRGDFAAGYMMALRRLRSESKAGA